MIVLPGDPDAELVRVLPWLQGAVEESRAGFRVPAVDDDDGAAEIVELLPWLGGIPGTGGRASARTAALRPTLDPDSGLMDLLRMLPWLAASLAVEQPGRLA